MKHPMQPLVLDPNGVVRFQKNEIVRTLLDWSSKHGLDLNALARRRFSQADWTQFYQLIGYSLSGFHQLSNVSDEDALAASAEARKQWTETGGCRDKGCEWHCGVEVEGKE